MPHHPLSSPERHRPVADSQHPMQVLGAHSVVGPHEEAVTASVKIKSATRMASQIGTERSA